MECIPLLRILGAINTTSQFESGENLLYNSDFESEINGEPAHWYKAWIPVDNLTMSWDNTVKYGGNRSVSISNTHDYEETVVNNWAQTITQVPINQVVELSGWVKTIDSEGVAMIMQCWDEDNNQIGFGSTQYTTNITGTTDWQMYKASLNIPKNTDRITVRLLLAGTGQVWFDDVQLEVK